MQIKESIILEKIEKNGNLLQFHFSCTSGLQKFFNSNILFCEYEQDISSVPLSILTIPFIGSIVGLCWLTNSTLWVPELDRNYYLGLKNVKDGYKEMYQDIVLGGRIVASKYRNNELKHSIDALLLFGGGVDAHTTFIRHIDEISTLVNIQGWYNQIDSIDAAAEADFEHCKNVARANGKRPELIRSNFASIVNADLVNKRFSEKLHDQWWHGLQHSMAFISISIPLAYKLKISKIFIGSSYTVGNNKSCASFPTTDSEFRYSSCGDVEHDAFEFSRQKKTALIVEYQKVTGRPYPLKVCSFNNRNCCECEKCFRTISAIIAEGGDPRNFGFNINDDVKSHFKDVLYSRIGLWGIEKELKYWLCETKLVMKSNYEIIEDKEFADWFMNYDFILEKKKGLRRYYRQNFFSILKRKLKID